MLIDPRYGTQDEDTKIFLSRFNEPSGSWILAIGANDEHSGSILTDNTHMVLGVDLREWIGSPPPNFVRLKGDFMKKTHLKTLRKFDVCYSLSAIEHFGLGCYGDPVMEEYDRVAMVFIWDLLKPGGHCYITVPYGAKHYVDLHNWQIYDKETLQTRIIGKFEVLEKVFFKSADCNVPDKNGIVEEVDADKYADPIPHLTVFLKMEKIKPVRSEDFKSLVGTECPDLLSGADGCFHSQG